MKELSNSTLALFVVTAIVISVFGTMLSVTKLNDVGLTGMASTTSTQTGTANLSVPATAYINLTDTLIAFGVMEIGGQNDSENANDWWMVRNDGSVNISIRVYSPGGDDQDGSGSPVAGSGPFTSQTTGQGCLAQSSLAACFMVKCQNSSAVDATCNTTYDALPVSASGATSRLLINNLLPQPSANDTAFFGVNVTVPADEPSGNKEQTVTFFAEESI